MSENPYKFISFYVFLSYEKSVSIHIIAVKLEKPCFFSARKRGKKISEKISFLF